MNRGLLLENGAKNQKPWGDESGQVKLERVHTAGWGAAQWERDSLIGVGKPTQLLRRAGRKVRVVFGKKGGIEN